MAKLDDLFTVMKQLGASDLFVSTGLPVTLKVHGDLTQNNQPPLTAEQSRALIYELLSQDQIKEFEKHWELDCSYNLVGVGRFRTNVFVHKNGIGALFRMIPAEIPSMDELNIPEAVRNMLKAERGLILVTGSTGSGKSTTLASLINHINETESGHIITIEDPLEFIHKNKKSIVRQREVHSTTKSFANALRASLRQDPDVILVGEMRDLETISLAMTAAETGHLVLGTLHTGGAAKTVDRIINAFPADQQPQIRVMLSESLKGVVSQTLFKKKGGKGRMAAFEVLVNTRAVANLIRENKTFQIGTQMQTGKAVGMTIFETEVLDMIQKGLINAEEGLSFLGKKVPGHPAGAGAGHTAGAGQQSVQQHTTKPAPPQAQPSITITPASAKPTTPPPPVAATQPMPAQQPVASPSTMAPSQATATTTTAATPPPAPKKTGFTLESLRKKS